MPAYLSGNHLLNKQHSAYTQSLGGMLSAISVAEMDSKLPTCKPVNTEAKNRTAAGFKEVSFVTPQV